MSILKVKNEDGTFIDIPAIVGPPGPAAYKAGPGIIISEDNIISAIGGSGGVSYEAGDNIIIEGNIISAVVPEDYVTNNELENSLVLKSDKTYVDEQLNLKSDKTYVDEQLNLKSDKTYVDEQLNLKSDKTNTYTKNETDNLIDNLESTVNINLTTKVNLGDVYTKSEIDTKLSDVTTDGASIEYVDEQLNLKADKVTTYTKDEVDNLLDSSILIGDTLPIGSMTLWSGVNTPSNWLLCDGREVSREFYSELFSIIGTIWGVGDGSTTFNLPNYTDRFPIGAGGDVELAETGGEKEHVLTIDEIPSHTHQINTVSEEDSIGSLDGLVETKKSTNYTVNSKQTGEGQAHNNMPPYTGSYYIIKAKQSAGVVATVVDNLYSNSSTDALSARQGKLLLEKLLEQAKKLIVETVIDYTFENSTTNVKEFNVSLGLDEVLDIKIMGGATVSSDVFVQVNDKATEYYLMSRGYTGTNTDDGTLNSNAIFRGNKTSWYPFHTLKTDQSLIEGQLFLKYSPVQKKYYPNYKWESYTAIQGAQTYGGGYGWLNVSSENITKIKFSVSSNVYFKAGTRIIINKRKMINYVESDV